MPKFSVGDVLLCFSRFHVRGAGAEILMLEVVEKVGSRFYSLAGRTYKPRESFANLESRAFRLPPTFPWRFPEEFCAFRHLLTIAYRSELISVYEAGVPYGRKFKRVVFESTGETYENPTEFGFVVRGFAIRQAESSSEEHWLWVSSRWGVLFKLKGILEEAEGSLKSGDSDLPEQLQEQGRNRWEAAPIGLRSAIKRPGDVFCEGSIRNGFSFYTFDRFTRRGKIKTIQYRPVGEARPLSLPTAFPPPILARLDRITHHEIFDETTLWVSHEWWRPSGVADSVPSASDRPGGAITVAVLGGLF